MWFKGNNNMFLKLLVLFLALNVYKGCEAITNADFNAQIRNYALVDDNLTLADVKTLQKQDLGLGRYANFAPLQNPVKFKEDVPDSVISASSHGRGLLQHGHTSYGFDYEEPHYGHAHDYQLHDVHHDPHEYHHDPHDYHHYDFHDSGHHHSPGHHHGYGYKHYDHGLASKALLWPIAGIALLGAAAALVSNPVLLQLGVVSGKRRRRNVEEIEHIAQNSIKKWSQITVDNEKHTGNLPDKRKKRMLRKDDFKFVKRVLQPGKGTVPQTVHQFETVNNNDRNRYSEEDRRYVPIPLQMKKT